MKFESTSESLKQHRVPEWFRDARLGIFVHWGPYSAPAFAPYFEAAKQERQRAGEGGEFNLKYNPYAEWYLNTLQFEDSPTAEYHRKTHGEDYA